MPVIEAQRASILVPHDHRHINHVTKVGTLGQAACVADGMPAGNEVCIGGTLIVSPTQHFEGSCRDLADARRGHARAPPRAADAGPGVPCGV